MRTTRIIGCMLFTGSLLAGLAGAAAGASPAAPGIEGTHWTLVQVGQGGTLADVPAGVTATLHLQDGVATGSGGCNVFHGPYTLSGNAISFGTLGQTMRACEAPAGTVEGTYLANLAAVASYDLAGDAMDLLGADGTVLLSFRAAEAQGVVGEWTVTGLNNGRQGVEGPLAGSTLTAIFGTDGSVTGSGGCNTYFGSYAVDSDAIKVVVGGSTKMSCGADLDAQETQYFAALGAATVWALSPTGELELRDASDALQVGYAPAPAGSVVGDWLVTGFNNGKEAVTSPIVGTDLTAIFSPDGTVGGSGGCNTFSGPYTIDGDGIKIGTLNSTAMACTEEIDTQEQQYYAALAAATTWSSTANGLELRDGSGALQVHLIPMPAS